MKAISTVIASILMLMIVMGLGGTTYLYISGTFTSSIATAFSIIDEVNGAVTIRNDGTGPITRIAASLDGTSANIAILPNIQGLLAYWSFNEGSGFITKDNSGNGNDGTIIDNEGDQWVDGQFGKALRFDGVNDYTVVADHASLDLPNDISVELWFWTTHDCLSGTQCPLIYKRGSVSGVEIINYGIVMNSADRVCFQIRRDPNTVDVCTTAPVNNGRWHHVVGVRDVSADRVRLYLDGTLAGDATDTIVGDITNNAGLLIGSGSASFNGVVDELAIYNRALSQSEIQQRYSGLSPGQLAIVKPLTSLTKGTHTLRLCTSSMCNTAILTIN